MSRLQRILQWKWQILPSEPGSGFSRSVSSNASSILFSFSNSR